MGGTPEGVPSDISEGIPERILEYVSPERVLEGLPFKQS